MVETNSSLVLAQFGIDCAVFYYHDVLRMLAVFESAPVSMLKKIS